MNYETEKFMAAMEESHKKSRQRHLDNVNWATLYDELIKMDEEYRIALHQQYKGELALGWIDHIEYVVIPAKIVDKDGRRSTEKTVRIETRSYWSDAESKNKTVLCMRAVGAYNRDNSFRTFIPNTPRKLKNLVEKINRIKNNWAMSMIRDEKEDVQRKVHRQRIISRVARDFSVPESKVKIPRYSSSNPRLEFLKGALEITPYGDQYRLSLTLDNLTPGLVEEIRRAATRVHRNNVNRIREAKIKSHAIDEAMTKLTTVRKAAK